MIESHFTKVVQCFSIVVNIIDTEILCFRTHLQSSQESELKITEYIYITFQYFGTFF